MQYKVLTLTQPMATLIAIGAKRIETRSWATKYRGPLLIHAAQGLGPVGGVRGLRDLAYGRAIFRQVLCAGLKPMNENPTARELLSMLPFGAIVAVVELDACWPIVDDEEYETTVSDGVFEFSNWHKVPKYELPFGNYTPGRYAWLLANVERLPVPIQARGRQGLWTWEGELSL
jgi:activating signal cointegrator 1